jgi:hypothetical protein
LAERFPPALSRRPQRARDRFSGLRLAIYLDEEQAIAVRQPNVAPALPLQNDQLLTERRESASSRAFDLNGETKMARTNRRSPIIRSAYAIRRPPQWNEVFGTDRPERHWP